MIDCGDNSCLFATNKGGMRTNGGCRCFENAGFGRSATGAAKPLLIEVMKLRDIIARATKIAEMSGSTAHNLIAVEMILKEKLI